MPRYRITDTSTLARSWIVTAPSEDAALDHAISHGPTRIDYAEEQVDTTPYEAERLPAAPRPRTARARFTRTMHQRS